MKGIIHIRIDDRLIHGQVAVLWTGRLNATRIMVINDHIANDPSQKSLMRMVVPEHINTSIIDLNKAVNNIVAGNYDGERVLVVAKSPLELLNIYNRGVHFESINIGNISSRDNTRKLKNGVFVTNDEFSALQQLEDSGVTITMIRTPDEATEFFNYKNYQ